MTKADLVKQLGLDRETFDYSLPQQWVNEVRTHLPQELKDEIAFHFVWLYDKEGGLFGRPASLSYKGNEILSHILMWPPLHLDAKYFQDPTFLSDYDLERLLMMILDKSNNDPIWMRRILRLALTWGNDCLDIALEFFHLEKPPSHLDALKEWQERVIPQLKAKLREGK